MPRAQGGDARLARYRRALEGTPLPAALVDLDALETNVDRLTAIARAGGKTLRVASKSVRCPALLRRILDRGAPTTRGLMTYDARETLFLAEHGFDDLLLAYPTLQRCDVDAIVAATRLGARACVVVDDAAQLDAFEAAAAQASGDGTRSLEVPVLVDLDVSYRPLGDRVHLGVRRSPLRTVADVLRMVEAIAARPHLRFHGVMAYEAHVAGVGDRDERAPLAAAGRRAMKLLARRPIESARRAVTEALAARGVAAAIFNGGGSGSVAWSSREAALTEVTAGSGFLDSHLFDGFRDVRFAPASFFALQVVRRPAPDLVTCHGGGFVASGAAGVDRLPIPALPEGMALLPLEGAGEVQTPLRVPRDADVPLGAPVFFRHAKAGELAEHFDEYLLVRGDRVVERAPTYRGLGRCFLG